MDTNERNKNLHMFLKWNRQPQGMFETNNIDVPDLAALLQCCGFALDKFEKAQENVETTSLNSAEEGMIRIEITCKKSGMKATLSKGAIRCKCPSEEAASKAEFWNVSGCSPSTQGNVNKSVSTLIPAVSSNQSKYINILLAKAFGLINGGEAGISQHNDSYLEPFNNASFLVRHRSLDTLKTETSGSFNNRIELPSFEPAPSTSPPKETSSPIPELCNSLKHVSLSSDKASKLVDNLKEIQKLVTESMEITNVLDATFTRPTRTKRISDIKISPLLAGDGKPPLTGSFIHVSKNKTPESSINRKITPIVRRTPKKSAVTTGEKRRYLVPPSKFVHMKAKHLETGTPARNTILDRRTDTPRPGTSKDGVTKDGVLKPKTLNLSAAKAKVAIKNDPSLASKLRPPTKVTSTSVAGVMRTFHK